MFSVPTLALPSIMACLIFRALKLGFIEEFEITSFRTPFSRVRFTPAEEISLHPCRFETLQYHMDTIKAEEDTQDDCVFGKSLAVSLVAENAEHLSNHV